MLAVPKVRQQAEAKTEDTSAVPAIGPDPTRQRLIEPLQTHKGPVTELIYRKPRAVDFIEIGTLPFDVRGDADHRRAVVDFKLAAQWVSRLTGHDAIVIGLMSHADWLGAVARINTILLNAPADAGN
jgi:hypothetical protein